LAERKERDSCLLKQEEKKGTLSPLAGRKERTLVSFSWKKKGIVSINWKRKRLSCSRKKRKGLSPVTGRKEKDCLF
jgi:hypothetical protein